MSKLQTIKPRIKSIDTRATRIGPTERERGRPAARARQRVLERDGYICQVCLPYRITIADEVDHVVPLHKGGHDTDANKQAICVECHRAKSERERVERG